MSNASRTCERSEANCRRRGVRRVGSTAGSLADARAVDGDVHDGGGHVQHRFRRGRRVSPTRVSFDPARRIPRQISVGRIRGGFEVRDGGGSRSFASVVAPAFVPIVTTRTLDVTPVGVPRG